MCGPLQVTTWNKSLRVNHLKRLLKWIMQIIGFMIWLLLLYFIMTFILSIFIYIKFMMMMALSTSHSRSVQFEVFSSIPTPCGLQSILAHHSEPQISPKAAFFCPSVQFIWNDEAQGWRPLDVVMRKNPFCSPAATAGSRVTTDGARGTSSASLICWRLHHPWMITPDHWSKRST